MRVSSDADRKDKIKQDFSHIMIGFLSGNVSRDDTLDVLDNLSESSASLPDPAHGNTMDMINTCFKMLNSPV